MSVLLAAKPLSSIAWKRLACLMGGSLGAGTSCGLGRSWLAEKAWRRRAEEPLSDDVDVTNWGRLSGAEKFGFSQARGASFPADQLRQVSSANRLSVSPGAGCETVGLSLARIRPGWQPRVLTPGIAGQQTGGRPATGVTPTREVYGAPGVGLPR